MTPEVCGGGEAGLAMFFEIHKIESNKEAEEIVCPAINLVQLELVNYTR